jgi:hypothetical protein
MIAPEVRISGQLGVGLLEVPGSFALPALYWPLLLVTLVLYVADTIGENVSCS